MVKREQQSGPNPIPPGYAPQPGDKWIRVIDLRREHQERVFEARGADGSGIRGVITDVTWHLLHGFIAMQFRDVNTWVNCGIDGWLLMKPEGWTEPTTEDHADI